MSRYNLQLIEDPADPRLRIPCKKGNLKNFSTDDLVKEMLDFVSTHPKCSRAVGLAANQVGVNRKVILVRLYPQLGGGPAPWAGLINPRIVDKGDTINYYTEGCLSHPGVQAKVGRPNWIKVVAVDNQSRKEVRFTVADDIPEGNMLYPSLARIICHEIDHIEGILFTDKWDTHGYELIPSGQEHLFKVKAESQKTAEALKVIE